MLAKVMNMKSTTRMKVPISSANDKYPRKFLVKTLNWTQDTTPKVGCHQLAAYMDSGLPSINDEASHWYCDNPLCVNTKHAVWESHFANVNPPDGFACITATNRTRFHLPEGQLASAELWKCVPSPSISNCC